MRVKWTSPALIDLRSIGAYVARHDKDAAKRLLKRIRLGAKLIGDHPYLGRPGHIENTRQLVLSGTSYTLVYALRDREVEILAVFHQRRGSPTSSNPDS